MGNANILDLRLLGVIFHSETVGLWTQGDDLLLRFKFYLLFLG